MELVLYYGTNDPGMKKHEMMMKSVLVRMGVKIRNVKPEQVMETIGCLAGMPGFQERKNVEQAQASQMEAGASDGEGSL